MLSRCYFFSTFISQTLSYCSRCFAFRIFKLFPKVVRRKKWSKSTSCVALVTSSSALPEATYSCESWAVHRELQPLHQRDPCLPVSTILLPRPPLDIRDTDREYKKPNRDFNALADAQIFSCNMLPLSKCRCFIVLPLSCGIARKERHWCHLRFSGGLDRTDGSPLL